MSYLKWKNEILDSAKLHVRNVFSMSETDCEIVKVKAKGNVLITSRKHVLLKCECSMYERRRQR
jgi:hypothetical protein